MSKKVEKTFKNLLISLFKNIFNRKKIEAINKDEIKKVLIVRLDNRIGNLVMLTPLIEETAKLFKNIQLDVVISGKFHEVLNNNPYINKTYLYEHQKFIKNPFKWVNLINQLRKNKYDLVFDASHPHSFSFSDALIANLSNPQFIIGFDRDNSCKFYNFSIKPNLNIHTIQTLLQLLEPFDYKNDNLIFPKIYLSSELENFAYDFYEGNKLSNKKTVIIFPGAKEGKKWGIDNFINLHNSLLKLDKDLIIIWILGPDENIYEEKIQNLNNCLITKNKSILENAAIIKRANGFISGDTGPMHISVAVGTPTFQIFLQTTDIRFGYNDNLKYFVLKSSNPNDIIYLISTKLKKLLYV